ncbi:hypothetical protein RJD28_02525 [Oscillospiraceae bacterium NTUH-002-81]|nr:hypothetical protein RJD28_02525 [Oscillospiraceae bacterium NTUH-002-81]
MKQIYVHGLGQTSDSWTKTIDILQTTDYSLCPNLPDLVHSKEVTYDNLYAAFSDYCNQYDEPIDLCGLSLGGRISSELCYTISEKSSLLGAYRHTI